MTGLLERSAATELIPGVRVRDARPGDYAAVREFLSGLSLDSAYRRFFTGIGSPPTATLVRRLVEPAPDRRVVLALASTTRPAAGPAHVTRPTHDPELPDGTRLPDGAGLADGARLADSARLADGAGPVAGAELSGGEQVVGLADTTVVDGGRAVELGVIIADRWQRRGLGWPLCAAALTPALALGVPLLRAHTLPDNARVAKILRRHWPDGAPRFADGTLLWELPLRAENVLGT